jgi:hypothetical protein
VLQGRRVRCRLAGGGPRACGDGFRSCGRRYRLLREEAPGTADDGTDSLGRRRWSPRTTGAMPACRRRAPIPRRHTDTRAGRRHRFLREEALRSADDGCDASLLAEDPEPTGCEERRRFAGRGIRPHREASICTDERCSNPSDDEPWSASAGVGFDSTEERFPFVGRRSPGCFGRRGFRFREAAPNPACRVRSCATDERSGAGLPEDGFGSMADGPNSLGRRTPVFHRTTGTRPACRSRARIPRASTSIPRTRGSRSSDDDPEAASAADGSDSGKRPRTRFAGRGAVPGTRGQAPACRKTTSDPWPTGPTPSGGGPRSSTRRRARSRLAGGALRVCGRAP